MNVYLAISGILMILTVIAHSVLGEKLIITPLQKSEGLPAVRGSTQVTKSTLRFAWHITSVLGVGMATTLFYYAGFTEFSIDQIFVLRVFCLTFFVSFIVAIVGSKAKHLSWLVFLFVSILTWLGTR